MARFSMSTPHDGQANFLDPAEPACADQYATFLRFYVYPRAVLRRLYPGEEGAGDDQSETAALKTRLELVIAKPDNVLSLW